MAGHLYFLPEEYVHLTEEVTELLDEVRVLEEENRILRYNLTTERSRYTLGGVPPGYRPWGNVQLPPPPSAESGRFDGS